MSLKNTIKEFATYLGDRESILDRNYQRIAVMIELHWGYKEYYPFMNKLLIMEKDKNRQGFPLEVLEEIYKLYKIHEELFPSLKVLN